MVSGSEKPLARAAEILQESWEYFGMWQMIKWVLRKRGVGVQGADCGLQGAGSKKKRKNKKIIIIITSEIKRKQENN